MTSIRLAPGGAPGVRGHSLQRDLAPLRPIGRGGRATGLLSLLNEGLSVQENVRGRAALNCVLQASRVSRRLDANKDAGHNKPSRLPRRRWMPVNEPRGRLFFRFGRERRERGADFASSKPGATISCSA
jgi:hypothetical protein